MEPEKHWKFDPKALQDPPDPRIYMHLPDYQNCIVEEDDDDCLLMRRLNRWIKKTFFGF